MKKINLLYISSSLDSIHEYRFLRLISGDKDINLTVTTCEPKPIHEKILGLDINIIKSPEAACSANLPFMRRVALEYRHWRYVGFLRKLIETHNIDIIHSGWLTLDSYDALKTGFHPVLAMSWGSDVLNDPYMKNPHTSRWFRGKLKYVAKNADAFYCDASIVADTLVKLTGIGYEKINVFPQPGVDMGIFHCDTGAGEKFRREMKLENDFVAFGCRGFLSVYGVENLLESVPPIIGRISNFKLVWAGEGPLKEKCIELARKLNIEGHVIFTGKLSLEQLALYYNAADVYVSTSFTDGSSAALQEAFCCGLVPIVSDIPANREWVRDGQNGWIVNPFDIESISGAVIKAYLSEDQRLLFREANLKVAKEDIDELKNYDRLKKLYCNIMQ
ncbi:MAG: glycosyltransferase family 4 protein [Victivallales bacterium]